jgi:hypothetical protein
MSLASLQEAPVTHEIAQATRSIALPHRDPADRLLVATALIQGLALAVVSGSLGHIFVLTGDQNVKTRFGNNRSGYRLSTSVGGSATGKEAIALCATTRISGTYLERCTTRQRGDVVKAQCPPMRIFPTRRN